MVLHPKSVVKEGLIFSFEQKGRKKGSYSWFPVLKVVKRFLFGDTKYGGWKKYRYQILIRKRKIEKKVLRVTEID